MHEQLTLPHLCGLGSAAGPARQGLAGAGADAALRWRFAGPQSPQRGERSGVQQQHADQERKTQSGPGLRS